MKKKVGSKREVIVCELQIGSPEWHYAWGYLAGHTGDDDREAYNDRFRESWGYLCSFMKGAKYFHEFRHRAHPIDDQRWVVHVPAREDWKPGDFDPQIWVSEIEEGRRFKEEFHQWVEEQKAKALGLTVDQYRVENGDAAASTKH